MDAKRFISAKMRVKTHAIFKDLSEKLDKPITSLLHEASLMLKVKYAKELAEAEAAEQAEADKTPDARLAA